MSRSGRWESKREAQATMFLTMGLFRPIVDFTPAGLAPTQICVNVNSPKQPNHKKEITMSEHIGNYKDLNGDTVRVNFENRRYYYETVDGTPDRYVSHQGPDSDRTLVRIT